MHILVILIEFCCISFRSKSRKPLFIDIDSKRLVTSHHNIYSQIKLIPIYQKWISDISGNNRKLVNIQIVYVIYNVDSPSSR